MTRYCQHYKDGRVQEDDLYDETWFDDNGTFHCYDCGRPLHHTTLKRLRAFERDVYELGFEEAVLKHRATNHLRRVVFNHLYLEECPAVLKHAHEGFVQRMVLELARTNANPRAKARIDALLAPRR